MTVFLAAKQGKVAPASSRTSPASRLIAIRLKQRLRKLGQVGTFALYRCVLSAIPKHV